MKHNKKGLRRLVWPVLILGILAAACLWYVSDYYHALPEAAAALQSGDGVTVTTQGNITAFVPDTPAAGLIFYPGGKVEASAYAPLLRAYAEQDILCLLVEMPCNLAVLNMNGADGLQARYPGVEHWYLGGHSLGGAMAASYAAKHADAFDGLVLLAAYSTADLSHSGLAVYSVYGTEDGVMNREKYETYRPNLPADVRETVLPGGCHALFGCYGAQAGDGTPTITGQQQVEATVACTLGAAAEDLAPAA